ncbi:MAG: HAMP domain-containing sensor histidine kinase [Paludibacteraceae bacterium]|nr:HAMP domain-containing sensor histidine kinase [Paludibacteraceae bacterium]
MYVEQRILFSQIVLILFIFIAGVIINPRHVIYVGTYSIIKMLFYAVVFKPPFIVDIFPYYITILVGIVVSFFIIIRTLYVFSYQSLVDSKLIDKKNKDLNQLINLKQDMISMILHDIRNSLNTILFASQENKLPTIVFNSVQHILQMADNFIDVHRMEENEVIIHPSNEFIKNTIYGAIEQVDYLLHEKNNWVKFYGVTSLQLNADHRLIERVFANILTNSIKHSLPNTPIEFRCEILSGHVRFEIINSGKPIHQDEVQSLFDKYVSNDQELKTNYNSKGLGLSFCKMVVQAHGGSIGFDTNYQKGVCIWFTLPDQNKYSSVTVVEQDLLSRLQLSPKEKKIIHPFSVRINQYEIYEISSIMQILDELTALDHPNIEYWKKELLNAILVWNKEYYDNLMAMVENSEADS